MPTKPKLPKTEAEWCAYRAQAACRIGRDALDNGPKHEIPPGVTRQEYALFNLLHAVEELAKLMALK